jgi:hypothetical protein
VLNKLYILDGKIMNIVSAVSWTDIPTEVMAISTICNQDSVRICSLAVNMNNTDESFFFTLGVLKLDKDTSDKFIAGDNHNGEKLSPMSLTKITGSNCSSVSMSI